jgi:hypothetical protein
MWNQTMQFVLWAARAVLRNTRPEVIASDADLFEKVASVPPQKCSRVYGGERVSLSPASKKYLKSKYFPQEALRWRAPPNTKKTEGIQEILPDFLFPFVLDPKPIT